MNEWMIKRKDENEFIWPFRLLTKIIVSGADKLKICCSTTTTLDHQTLVVICELQELKFEFWY